MKVIAARMVNGEFPQVGMNNRTIFKGKRLKDIIKRAQVWAGGRAIKLEVYNNEDKIYGYPNKELIIK